MTTAIDWDDKEVISAFNLRSENVCQLVAVPINDPPATPTWKFPATTLTILLVPVADSNTFPAEVVTDMSPLAV